MEMVASSVDGFFNYNEYDFSVNICLLTLSCMVSLLGPGSITMFPATLSVNASVRFVNLKV